MLSFINKSERISSPACFYDQPADLVHDRWLSKNEKKKALKNWKDEEIALLRSEDENMGAQTKAGRHQTRDASIVIASIEQATRELEQ